ncbi:hypothetical protein NDU88_003163 [Pleurodeles waltl]|uniref:Uncharacterized protein n=1 Tax=Pleurodeles waltl TaxID=8319 RepID=A0AAV7WNL8_PLEWA|nr:hypothetical protein NDU88_003163 [Pleurodeles waltl]
MQGRRKQSAMASRHQRKNNPGMPAVVRNLRGISDAFTSAYQEEEHLHVCEQMHFRVEVMKSLDAKGREAQACAKHWSQGAADKRDKRLSIAGSHITQ